MATKKKETLEERKKRLTDQYADTSWLRNGRYIYFSSLLSEPNASLQALGQHQQHHLRDSFSINMIKETSYTDFNSYMINYINLLQQWANAEFAAEMKFFSQLNQATGLQETDFLSNGKFDYISFIKKINELLINEDLLKKTIETNLSNMAALDKTLNELDPNAASIQETTDRNVIDMLNAYAQDRMQIYWDAMSDTKLTASVAEQVQQYINNAIHNYLEDPKVAQIYTSQLYTTRSAVTAILNDITQNLTMKTRFSESDLDITKNIPLNNMNAALNRANLQIQTKLEQFLTQEYTTIEKIIDAALNRTGGIAKMIEEADAVTRNQILNYVQNNKTVSDNLKTLLDLTNPSQTKDTNDSQLKKKLRVARAQLTRSYRQAMESVYQSIIQSQNNKEQIRQALVDKILQTISTSKKELIQYCLNKFSITLFNTGELLAEIGRRKDVIGALDTYTPARDILLKSDVLFTWMPEDLVPLLHPNNPVIPKSETEFIHQFQEKFLKTYKEKGKGHTDVSAAIEAWKVTQQQHLTQQKNVLNKIKDQKKRDKTEQLLKNIVHGSISVKEYHYYNNLLGYHSGSLGGGGRVVDAIPNIIKMLEQGGISNLDAELIIQCLLNCFDDSVLGAGGSYAYKDIESVLIGGAAMMLFDDGFANGKKFLETMENELKAPASSFGTTMHLLTLNGIYIPQSYLLQSIVNNLRTMVNDVMNNLQSSRDTLDTTKNRLYLDNPLSYKDLENLGDDWPNTRVKWQAMSELAQEKVHINFLFMGGMLDIMQELENAFKNPYN